MKYKIKKKIVIVGAGRLGTAVGMGLFKSGVSIDQIIFVQRNEKTKKGVFAFQVVNTLEEADINGNTELVIIAVKPKDMDEVLMAMNRNIHRSIPIVSLAAQITLNELKEKLNRSSAVFRVKPNILIQDDKGCILIKKQNDDPSYAKVLSIFSLLGDVFELSEEELETYTWYSAHIPCVFLPKLIQSMFKKESDPEKEQLLLILVSALEGLLDYLKKYPQSAQSIDEFIDRLPQQTMSPNGLNDKAFSYLERNNALPIINEAREVYCKLGGGSLENC